MIEIDKNIIVETEHLGSNNSIIVTRDGVVLIDAPHRPSDAIRWRRTAQSCGNVVYLFNTDHHIDHTMCNCFLPGTIVSHQGTRDRLMTSAPTRQYVDDLLDVIDPAGRALMDGHYTRLPTVTYQESMTVHLGGLDFEFTHLPGHTLNGSLIYLRQQKVAFTGDIICSAGLPAFIDGDAFAWIEAVKHIEAITDIRYIVPGHGKVCDLAFATTFRKWIEDLVAEVQAQIDKGNSREQAMKQVTYEDYIHIATGESPAYPQYLMDMFITKSIGVIYDQILARRA